METEDITEDGGSSSHFPSLFGFHQISPRCGGSSCVSERWCGVKEVAAEGGWVGRSTHPQPPITVFWDGTAPCSVQRLFHGFSSLCADINTVKKDKQTQKTNRLCDVLASNKSKHLIMCTLRTKLLHDERVACSLQPAAADSVGPNRPHG